jgi:hypothetical protein
LAFKALEPLEKLPFGVSLYRNPPGQALSFLGSKFCLALDQDLVHITCVSLGVLTRMKSPHGDKIMENRNSKKVTWKEISFAQPLLYKNIMLYVILFIYNVVCDSYHSQKDVP